MTTSELRELDYKVLELVFGYTYVKRDDVAAKAWWSSHEPVGEAPDGDKWVPPTGLCMSTYEPDSAKRQSRHAYPSVPRFSENVADAWKVVAKMGQWMFDMKWGFDGDLCSGNWQPIHMNCSAAGWTVTLGSHTEVAGSAPLAICRAAICVIKKKV